MAVYTLRDAERLLRVKIHILRYWEKEIPLIQPEKDNQGHVHYSDRDMQIFFRLKYLVQDRHFTLEGAREELYRECAGDGEGSEEQQNLRAGTAAIRSSLMSLLDMISKNKEPCVPSDPA
jgi:DNA-binding transcriptional MerR regulator